MQHDQSCASKTVSLGTCAQTILFITQPVRSGTITWTKRTIDPVNTSSVMSSVNFARLAIGAFPWLPGAQANNDETRPTPILTERGKNQSSRYS